MKASDYIASFLNSNGVNVVFEMIGGMTTHMIDSLHLQEGIDIVSLHHEQAAGFAAEAFGRITGKPGVTLATSGPGATNLITAIGSCFFDSVPCLFITGQVNTFEQKNPNSDIRQLGFQETDIVSIVKPITKYARKVEHVKDLPDILEEAFKISMDGRPGPVLLDIPMDIQRLEVETEINTILLPYTNVEYTEISVDLLKNLKSSIEKAKKPLILVGGGVRSSKTEDLLSDFVKKVNIPLVYSLMGWDAFTEEDLRVGFIGSYGNRWANFALAECDLLIVLGSRLDVRQTGAQADEFAKGKTIFHVDIVKDEMNNRLQGCHAIHSSLYNFFKNFEKFYNINPFSFDSEEWMGQIEILKNKYSDLNELRDVEGINPNAFLKTLSKSIEEEVHYVTDVGQHQMWAAQSIEAKKGQRFLTSGGMGSMGFGLPTAIGSYFSSKVTPIVIAGDGGFQCNIQELEAVAHHKLPIKMIVLNNNSLGMVRHFQETYFEGRLQSTVWGYSAPNFVKVSEAYNIRALGIKNELEIDNAIKWLMEGSEPKLLEVKIGVTVPVNPKLEYGKPLSKMSPELD